MFCLSLHYNGESSYLFVNGRNLSNNRTLRLIKSVNFPFLFCLGSISEKFDTTGSQK